MAHSWWGNGVLVDHEKGNWSEGLATYVADHLYKERSSPEEGREYRLKILRDYRTLVPAGEEIPLASFAGHDVVYLGLPQGKGYLPSLPGELAVSPGRFTLVGETYDAPGDSLFAVLPHSSDGDRVAALFLSLSPQAASRAARKIPHYGGYSYLAFSLGNNRAKGTWTAGPSPTVHEFPDPGASPQEDGGT